MTPSAMADRLLAYCDAIAGFSVVNTLAFLIALAEPDVRCTLVETTSLLYVGILVGAALQNAGLVYLRGKERLLREASGEELNPQVAQTMHAVQVGRIGLVWFYSLVLIGVLWASSNSTCG